jgi:hypothetical protein
MRIAALVVVFTMVLAWPFCLRAQDSQTPQQTPNGGWQLHDPNEYTQDDSHPVRAIASLLSPVGWALEWGVARPWHYVATQTFLAPVLNGGQDDDSWSEYYGTSGSVPQPPMMAPPPAQPAPPPAQQAFREQSLGTVPVAPPAPGSSTSQSNPVQNNSNPSSLGAPPYPSQPPTQPVLH